MSSNNRMDDISLIRVLCILVVVFFHCYGMMFYESFFPATIERYRALYWTINQCVFINIAMPMFVFISGYLFKYLLSIGKYPTWGNLLKKKGLRIILPYFVFGIFFMIVTNDLDWATLFKGLYWHLWFLPMLFWCFLIGYSVNRLIKDKGVLCKSLLLGALYIGTWFPKFLPSIFGLHYMSQWFFWFYGGMLLYEYKDVLYDKMKHYKLYLLFILLYLLSVGTHPVEYGDQSSRWLNTLGVLFLIISICYFFRKAHIYGNKLVEQIVNLSKYSFGIYIFHNWVAVLLISNTAKHLFHLELLALNHIVLFPLCFTVLTIIVSWFLSWCMMKTKVGRFLIG